MSSWEAQTAKAPRGAWEHLLGEPRQVVGQGQELPTEAGAGRRQVAPSMTATHEPSAITRFVFFFRR